MLEIETVAVVGAGPDAVRAALLCALAGLSVRAWGETPDALDAAFHALRDDVDRALAGGAIGPGDRQRILDGILFTTDLGEAVVGADLAWLAPGRDAAEARRLLGPVAAGCRATALLALPEAPGPAPEAVAQPGRVLGLALGSETPLPRVVLRPGPGTTPHARERAAELLDRLARAAVPPRAAHSSR